MPQLSAVHSDHGYDAGRASDQALMSHIADGDTEAFAEIYRRHSGHALIQARKLCASRELAEEVAQETFISLWRSAHRYRPGLGSVSVWLASMVRNRAIDAWRRAAVRPVETPAYEDGPGQLRSAVGAETPPPERAAVLALIAELPPPQKEAVFLAYFGGMTHAEIADWADAPIGTIKGRIRLGLEKLRAGLEEQAQPPRPQMQPSRTILRPGATYACHRGQKTPCLAPRWGTPPAGGDSCVPEGPEGAPPPTRMVDGSRGLGDSRNCHRRGGRASRSPAL